MVFSYLRPNSLVAVSELPLSPPHTLSYGNPSHHIDKRNVTQYSEDVIIGFTHKGLRRLYERGERQGIGANMLARVEEILSILDAAETLEEIDIPGYRLHPLTGNLKGFWSIRVTGNWRIIFRFEQGEASDIDLIDYH